jgi:predicted glycosyltransferase
MGKMILVAPLNWGLGHATRCVPIINELQKQGATVVLGANGLAAKFLQDYYPTLGFLHLPSYEITYQHSGSFSLNMLMQLPNLAQSIQHDQKLIRKVAKQLGIKGIISDNRYGVYHPDMPSVIVTHQLAIQAIGLQRLGVPFMHYFIRKYLKSFTNCWIPDYEQAPGLAGKLSHPDSISLQHQYVGPLSRFSHVGHIAHDPDFDIMAILSGPEPQRSLLEQEILNKSTNFNGKVLLLRGLPGTNQILSGPGNVTIFNHLADAQLLEMLAKSRTIICRSGYSSIMDLEVLGRHAFLVPTPGQPEQEYLAKLHADSGGFTPISQGALNLNLVANYKPQQKPKPFQGNTLSLTIAHFLQSL